MMANPPVGCPAGRFSWAVEGRFRSEGGDGPGSRARSCNDGDDRDPRPATARPATRDPRPATPRPRMTAPVDVAKTHDSAGGFRRFPAFQRLFDRNARKRRDRPALTCVVAIHTALPCEIGVRGRGRGRGRGRRPGRPRARAATDGTGISRQIAPATRIRARSSPSRGICRPSPFRPCNLATDSPRSPPAGPRARPRPGGRPEWGPRPEPGPASHGRGTASRRRPLRCAVSVVEPGGNGSRRTTRYSVAGSSPPSGGSSP